MGVPKVNAREYLCRDVRIFGGREWERLSDEINGDGEHAVDDAAAAKTPAVPTETNGRLTPSQHSVVESSMSVSILRSLLRPVAASTHDSTTARTTHITNDGEENGHNKLQPNILPTSYCWRCLTSIVSGIAIPDPQDDVQPQVPVSIPCPVVVDPTTQDHSPMMGLPFRNLQQGPRSYNASAPRATNRRSPPHGKTTLPTSLRKILAAGTGRESDANTDGSMLLLSQNERPKFLGPRLSELCEGACVHINIDRQESLGSPMQKGELAVVELLEEDPVSVLTRSVRTGLLWWYSPNDLQPIAAVAQSSASRAIFELRTNIPADMDSMKQGQLRTHARGITLDLSHHQQRLLSCNFRVEQPPSHVDQAENVTPQNGVAIGSSQDTSPLVQLVELSRMVRSQVVSNKFSRRNEPTISVALWHSWCQKTKQITDSFYMRSRYEGRLQAWRRSQLQSTQSSICHSHAADSSDVDDDTQASSALAAPYLFARTLVIWVAWLLNVTPAQSTSSTFPGGVPALDTVPQLLTEYPDTFRGISKLIVTQWTRLSNVHNSQVGNATTNTLTSHGPLLSRTFHRFRELVVQDPNDAPAEQLQLGLRAIWGTKLLTETLQLVLGDVDLDEQCGGDQFDTWVVSSDPDDDALKARAIRTSDIRLCATSLVVGMWDSLADRPDGQSDAAADDWMQTLKFTPKILWATILPLEEVFLSAVMDANDVLIVRDTAAAVLIRLFTLAAPFLRESDGIECGHSEIVPPTLSATNSAEPGTSSAPVVTTVRTIGLSGKLFTNWESSLKHCTPLVLVHHHPRGCVTYGDPTGEKLDTSSEDPKLISAGNQCLFFEAPSQEKPLTTNPGRGTWVYFKVAGRSAWDMPYAFLRTKEGHCIIGGTVVDQPASHWGLVRDASSDRIMHDCVRVEWKHEQGRQGNIIWSRQSHILNFFRSVFAGNSILSSNHPEIWSRLVEQYAPRTELLLKGIQRLLRDKDPSLAFVRMMCHRKLLLPLIETLERSPLHRTGKASIIDGNYRLERAWYENKVLEEVHEIEALLASRGYRLPQIVVQQQKERCAHATCAKTREDVSPGSQLPEVDLAPRFPQTWEVTNSTNRLRAAKAPFQAESEFATLRRVAPALCPTNRTYVNVRDVAMAPGAAREPQAAWLNVAGRQWVQVGNQESGTPALTRVHLPEDAGRVPDSDNKIRLEKFVTLGNDFWTNDYAKLENTCTDRVQVCATKAPGDGLVTHLTVMLNQPMSSSEGFELRVYDVCGGNLNDTGACLYRSSLVRMRRMSSLNPALVRVPQRMVVEPPILVEAGQFVAVANTEWDTRRGARRAAPFTLAGSAVNGYLMW